MDGRQQQLDEEVVEQTALAKGVDFKGLLEFDVIAKRQNVCLVTVVGVDAEEEQKRQNRVAHFDAIGGCFVRECCRARKRCKLRRGWRGIRARVYKARGCLHLRVSTILVPCRDVASKLQLIGADGEHHCDQRNQCRH